MRARKWGRIINLTSVAAQAGSMLAVHYSAAKPASLRDEELCPAAR
jgi:NAD(P)-dependent dehydrogenase (short-subunit alcohol dehydrogenase family)